jgi:O-antigen/teichoic acid export membrane protein
MAKALEMGKSSATGSFHLLIGVAGSTIIMAIGTIVLAWLLNPDQVGLYGMKLIPSGIINFFRDWSVNSALTQQIASLRAAGRDRKSRCDIFRVIFEILSGLALALICFALASPIAYLLNLQTQATSPFTYLLCLFQFSLAP